MSKQIIIARIIATAAVAGSTAKTAKGAIKFLRQNRDPRPLYSRGRRAYNRALDYVQVRTGTKSAIIPLGILTNIEVSEACKKLHPHRRNWRSTKAVASGPIRVVDINCGRYSSRCSFTKWEYEPQVQSYGAIDRNGILKYIYDGQITALEAPHGYRWAKDENGVLLISNDGKKDYHPDSDDLRNYSKADIRAMAIDNYRTRVAADKERKEVEASVKRAEGEGAMVCLRDSVRAGNCAAGTVAFGLRHGLDKTKHYAPSRLLAIANGNAGRVRLAVTVALKRHRQEMRRGFCLLEDHR